MDFTILAEFRRKTYDCFTRAKDALMNVVDALLTETPARSLAELSLSPCFERHWSSLYEAFQDGNIQRDDLQKLFAEYVPEPNEGERLVVGGDGKTHRFGCRCEQGARKNRRLQPVCVIRANPVWREKIVVGEGKRNGS